MEEKTYFCLQPTYMNQFQCDGSLCRSQCCMQDWIIEFDANTYQRYCSIKSEKERKAITSHLRMKKKGGERIFELMHGKKGCPFLRKDYFCGIQKKYGEAFLPVVCATYPRRIYRLDEMMERGLMLSCPVAAKLVLAQKEPMEFEQTEIGEKRPMVIADLKMKDIPMLEHLVDLQYGSISLLQSRSLTIDQRLILLGFFMEQAEELVANGKGDEIHAFVEGFISEQVIEEALDLVGAISLQPKDYLRCMFGMRESLYGRKSGMRYEGDRAYLDALADLYHLSKDKQEIVSLDKLQAIYEGYRDTAKALVQKYSYIFENCMVNEFFIGLYPFRLAVGGFRENYLYFLMSYKMMEFLTIASAVVRENHPKEDVLIEGLSFFSGRIEHNEDYRRHIREEILRQQKDMAFFMRALLDGAPYRE